MVKIIKGNIFNLMNEGDFFVHQTNCFGIMGGGIARTVRELFPKTYLSYNLKCQTRNKKELLGTALIIKDVYKGMNINMCNCFGQFDCGTFNGPATQYDKLKSAFIEVREAASISNSRIIMPYYIGCGLAGGDWEVVSEIIEEVFKGMEVVLVDFDGSEIL